MRNIVEHPSTESVVEQFTGEDVTNSQITIFKQGMLLKSEIFKFVFLFTLLSSQVDSLGLLQMSHQYKY